MTAFLVVGGLTLLFCLMGSVALALAVRSETGQKVMGAIGKGVNLVEKGEKAPGIPELRAAGCSEPLVVDTQDALELAAIFSPSDEQEVKLDRVMVFCQIPRFKSGASQPRCEVLARVYARAAAPTEPFLVLVQRKGYGSRPLCMTRHDVDGTLLNSFDGFIPEK